MEYLLEVNNLQVEFDSEKGKNICVDDVCLNIKKSETIGIVGESGCGKSVTALSIMQLLGGNGYVSQGEILFDGVSLLELSEKQMNNIRGNRISMIFQDTMTTLNPVFTIGNQIIETIRLHLGLDKKNAHAFAVEMLEKVGLPRPKEIMKEYPHTLSGGMRQRVMIAMALACSPKLLIADEPTTALDVTIQAQILRLMKDLKAKSNTAIILITHDIGVIAEMADRVFVMYAGQIVEESDVFTLFDNPKHPYTKALMKSIPKIHGKINERIISIPGMVPSNYQNIKGCRFSSRCPMVIKQCLNSKPAMKLQGEGHYVRCINVDGSEVIDNG
jgi:peptide/nickel transport system ATP-binding protein